MLSSHYVNDGDRLACAFSGCGGDSPPSGGQVFSERIVRAVLSPGDPVSPGELVNGVMAIEPPQPGVLLTTERRIRLVVHSDVVDVGHAGHNPSRELDTPLHVASENRTGKSVLTRIREV